MPRVHKKLPGSRRYQSCSNEIMQLALKEIESGRISINKAAIKYNIAKGTLFNKVHKKHEQKYGRPAVFTNEEQDSFVQHALTVSQWGFPFDLQDVRYLGKLYLDKIGRKVPQFGPTNVPGIEWATSFMKRHKDALAIRTCQNLKSSKSAVTATSLQEYFNHLKTSLTEENSDTGDMIPPNRIFNYDETNLCDNPGVKKCVFKRGIKYAESVKDSAKASTSVMFCGSATGEVLPPYVVYKAEHLWESWMQGRPKNTRYNRSRSGWFDATIFGDWFANTFVPHAKRLGGKVSLIGDNLSSHFSPEALKLAQENNIVFICLPKNATHLCQPLDVAFYGPMKKYWRKILDAWKEGKKKRSKAITKESFPKLLNDVYGKVCDTTNGNVSKNLIAGFRKCGIFPFNPHAVIGCLPDAPSKDLNAISPDVGDCVVQLLTSMRHGPEDKYQCQY